MHSGHAIRNIFLDAVEYKIKTYWSTIEHQMILILIILPQIEGILLGRVLGDALRLQRMNADNGLSRLVTFVK